MNKVEKTFIIETLVAIQTTGARIGKKHYSVVLSKIELSDLISRLKYLQNRSSL